MKIKNNRLVDEWYGRSKDTGGILSKLRFVVLHYTAGGSAAASRDYMMKSPTEKGGGDGQKKYASAHAVVDRDGSCWQIVPFNIKARHAGTSRWKGLDSLNQYSIGIEIANYGWLDKQGDGNYSRRGETPTFKPADVVLGAMPGSTEIRGWEPYPEPQLTAVEQLVTTLIDKYPAISEVLGHQEISPGRKFDPGPAFPMQRFRNLIDNRGFGAMERTSAPAEPVHDRLITSTNLNIREGAGTGFEKLPESPLAPGTELQLLEKSGIWDFVQLSKKPQVRGWVHSSYVTLIV
ncbi:MAG: N-acetylmuramoyl-L-alanine amidase [Gammaproteobacteria bacterium]|nr:N-acetylmuramoyl-L-alanine amidase [Gammaproteobacteria bacterium]